MVLWLRNRGYRQNGSINQQALKIPRREAILGIRMQQFAVDVVQQGSELELAYVGRPLAASHFYFSKPLVKRSQRLPQPAQCEQPCSPRREVPQ